jgi:hypothetical protein
MKTNKRLAVATLAATCALAGAAAGISESSAAKSSSTTGSAHAAGGAGMPAPGHGGPGGPRGHEVHAVEVVLNKAGTAYISETDDNGTITAIDSSAGTITLKEGTSSVTYATPTITIPSAATIQLDGAAGSLAKLAVGDEVTISSSSEGTTVFATDSSFKPAAGHGPGGQQPPSGQAPPVERSTAG